MGNDKIESITKSATQKFGKIFDFKEKKEGALILMIERTSPAIPHLPFMTITASIYGITNEGEYAVDFYWGHYDLNKEEALLDLAKRGA